MTDLEREIRNALQRLAALERQQNGDTLTPEEEVAAEIRSAILSLREVLSNGQTIKDVLAYTPALQAAETGDPWDAFASIQRGDYQDVVNVWRAFEVWLATPVDVVDASDGTTVLRQVTPRELIQRRGNVYEQPTE